jgi:hypothetical protein
MKNFNIYDDVFSHNDYSCLNCDSKYMAWEFNPKSITNDQPIFFTDLSYQKVVDFKHLPNKKIAWLMESPAVFPNVIHDIMGYVDMFDTIFTLNEDLIKLHHKFKLVPYWCIWIKEGDRKIYDKTKMTSIIASNKMTLEGHKLRHLVINYFHKNMDVYGNGYRFINDKLEGLKDYRFSIVIENVKQNVYFTEKLLDCFATGTIPIYWGCENLSGFFNENGILRFNDLDSLYLTLSKLTEDKYNELLPHVIDNYNRVNKYKSPEDFMYLNYLNKFN